MKSRPADPYAALRVPAYRFYASAWMLAVFGSQVQSVALQWDLYKRTGDAMVLGWIGLIQAIPVISLAIPAGQLADHFSRQRILMCTQFGSVLASLGLLWCAMNDAPIHSYYMLLFCDAIMNAIGWPARSSIVPLLVPQGTLASAVTWNSSLFHLASVSGPAVGGFVLSKSLPACYAIHACTALWYVICMMLIRPTQQQQVSKKAITFESLMAGLRFVFQQKIILATISLDLFAVLLGGAVYLLPAVAKDWLHVNEFGFGLLRAAPAIGAICMGLTLAHLRPMKQAGRAMLWAVAGFGAATIVFGISRNYAVSLVALFLTGALDNISVVVRHTLVQVLTPDEMRGRVSAVNNVFIGASNELGGFESGLTTKLFGLTASIVGGGIGTILVVAGVDRLFPQVRAFGALHEAKPIADELPSDPDVANEAPGVQ